MEWHIITWISTKDPPYFNTDDSRRLASESLAKLQIDNHLSLYGHTDNLILATNFEWEYRGLKTFRIPGPKQKLVCPTSYKILGLKHLLDFEVFDRGDVCWFHDLDVMQNIHFDFPDLSDSLLGLMPQGTKKGQPPKFTICSFFFRPAAAWVIQEIYNMLVRREIKRHGPEEGCLNKMIKTAKLVSGIHFVEMNQSYTYNFKPSIRHMRGKGDFSHIIDSIDWPVKAVKFGYAPMHHTRMWKRGRKLTDRLLSVIYQ